MGGGDFTQGLAGGIQNAMQMRQQAMDNQMRADYMKTQKKLLDMQWKAAEMEEQWWNQQPQNIRSLKFMPKEAQTIGMLMSGIMPLPGMAPAGGGTGSPSPAPAPAPTMAAGGPPMALPTEGMPPQAQPQGTSPMGGGVVDIITQARNNPMLGGLLKKFMGSNPGEITYKSGIADPVTGKPLTIGLDVSGKQIPDISMLEAEKPETAQQRFSQSKDLRKEFTDISKTFRDVRDSFARIQESAESPSAAGDLALIFNYMKMLDPGSTVREGEFANAQNSGGVSDVVRAQYNKVMRGERLSDNMRNDFLGRAEMLYGRQVDQYGQNKSEYERLAQQMGINPREVIIDFSMVPAKRKAKPDLGLGKRKTGRKPLTAFEGQ